jgi:hypothetical protein
MGAERRAIGQIACFQSVDQVEFIRDFLTIP